MVSPVPVYTIEAPLRTSDSVTQLLWDSSSIASDQVAAGTACGELGEGVWRLPTLIELASLVDYGKAPPYIDVLFGVEDTAWSSNPGVAFNFLTGSPTSSSGTEALKVLCVQGVGLTPSFSTNGAVEALSGLEFGVQNSLGAWIGQLQDCAGRAATAKELLLFASGGSALTMPPDGVWTSSPDSKSVSQALVFLPATSPPSIVSAAINTSFPIVCISSP